MSNISGRSAIAMTAAAGAVVVGGALWFDNNRTDGPEAVTDVTAAVTPAPKAEAIAESVEDAPADAVDSAAVEDPVEEASQNTASAQENAEAGPKADDEPVSQAALVPKELAFDEVRREDDGMTIIAGRGEPGASVEILQDGASISKVTADGQGKFAAIAMIAPDGQGHVLSLVQTVDGVAFPSEDQIILAPVEAAVVVAEVAPQAEPKALDAAVEVEQPEDAAAETASTEVVEAPDEVASNVEPITDQETVAEVDLTVTETAEPTAEKANVDPQPAETAKVEIATSNEQAVVDLAQNEEPAQTSSTNLDSASATPRAVEPAAQSSEPNADTTTAKAEDTSTAFAPDAEASEPEATPQVAVLKTTQDGIELLNVPRPEAMENVAIDTISYSDAGDVQLAGRAQTDTRTVRVYLDNRSIVSLNVDAQGRWRGDLPDVDEGIYTLRVDEVAVDGSVTSRVETPFKREAPEVLAQAAAASDGPLKKITVQKGATLWAIAQERYGDGLLYVNVFQANSKDIRDPNLIYPGQVFDLPDQ